MAEVTLGPRSLVVNGAIVNSTNPLPVTSVAAGDAADDVSLNPATWVVNGAIVSTSNPLPITMV